MKKAEIELTKAINKDRPEVFAYFGSTHMPTNPKSTSTKHLCLQVTNRGKSDAWHVQVTPFDTGRLKVDFFEIDILMPGAIRSTVEVIEGRPGTQESSFEYVLSQGAVEGSHIKTPLITTWRDSSGNYFVSESAVYYYPEDGKSYTEFTGSVTLMGRRRS